MHTRKDTCRNVIGMLAMLLICGGLVFTAVWIRIQNRHSIPDGQFTENDAYFYYYQAGIIAEHGKLPERDMHRWLPLGRDNQQTLNLYPYALAYAHKAVAAVFPNGSLYHVTLYMPILCFCIGLCALCCFLYHTYGFLFSITVGVLLASLPGSIERSAAGYSDRDAWCLMLGILSIITYLASLQAHEERNRLLWTLLSGGTVFLGGISWEGFGVFISVILIVEIWRFLTTENEVRLGLYLLWVLCFVPTLYLASEAYRSGYGFAKHLTAFVLVPPIVLLGIRGLRHLLLSKVDKLCPHARPLSLGLTLASIALALGYVFIQHSTFADTTVPFSQNMLMQSVTELRPPNFNFWYSRYGIVFLLGSLGAILTPFSLWKKQGYLLSFALVLFALTTFFRYPLERMWGESFGNVLFGMSLIGGVLAFIAFAWRRNSKTAHEYISLAFLALFIVWVALARDARRYHFFLGISLAFLTTESLRVIADTLTYKIQTHAVPQNAFKGILTLGLLGLILFCPPTGGYARNAHTTAEKLNAPLPRDPQLKNAYEWMKTTLPNTTVVAARWYYGSQLNVLGGVKTIIDQDHYIPQWIHLHRQYISLGLDEHEMLAFLKTHKATHLMIPQKHPAYAIEQGQASGSLVPVYPTDNFAEAALKIWELHYPPDIKTDPKYLSTSVPEIDAYLQSK